MKRTEAGFLLLTSQLGDPERPVLTTAQLRKLANRVAQAERRAAGGDLTVRDLTAMGYDRNMAQRILGLLEQEEQLRWYLRAGRNCVPVTRVSNGYPRLLRDRLGMDCPGSLWAKGDLSLLERPAVALVGSRDLSPINREFARRAGVEAAKQGFVLVSGNAVGADRTAQEACLNRGGRVISVVADRLDEKPDKENILYLSEDGYDLPFSSRRALSRNRLIHSLGAKTLVAQCHLGKGGTWDGTVKNLRHNWSPVFCFADGSKAAAELVQMGAVAVGMDDLTALDRLQPDIMDFMGL